MTKKEKILKAVSLLNELGRGEIHVEGFRAGAGDYGDLDADLSGVFDGVDLSAVDAVADYAADTPEAVVFYIEDATITVNVFTGEIEDDGPAIVNLTPHAVPLYRAEDVEPAGAGSYKLRVVGDELEPAPSMILSPSGEIARAAVSEESRGHVGGVPLVCQRYGEPENLPAPRAGVFLVVSALTAQAAEAAGRPVHDLLIPAHMVRDAGGRILGCSAFSVMEGSR